MVPVGVLCAGPPDQSRKQAVDGRAGLARRSKRVGIDVGPFGLVAPGWHSQATLGRHPLGGRVRTHAPGRPSTHEGARSGAVRGGQHDPHPHHPIVRRCGPNTRSQSATHPHSPPRPRGEAADNEREGLPRQLDIDFGWSSLIVDAAIQADNLTLDLATIRYVHAVLLGPVEDRLRLVLVGGRAAIPHAASLPSGFDVRLQHAT